jgi:hypothetical protein
MIHSKQYRKKHIQNSNSMLMATWWDSLHSIGLQAAWNLEFKRLSFSRTHYAACVPRAESTLGRRNLYTSLLRNSDRTPPLPPPGEQNVSLEEHYARKKSGERARGLLLLWSGWLKRLTADRSIRNDCDCWQKSRSVFLYPGRGCTQ